MKRHYFTPLSILIFFRQVSDLCGQIVDAQESMAEGHLDRRPTLQDVITATSALFNIPGSYLKGPCRSQDIALPRMLAMLVARQQTSASYPRLGRAFGGRDHTTALSGIRRMTLLVRNDDAWALRKAMLEKALPTATDRRRAMFASAVSVPEPGAEIAVCEAPETVEAAEPEPDVLPPLEPSFPMPGSPFETHNIRSVTVECPPLSTVRWMRGMVG